VDAADRWLELLPVEARLAGEGFDSFDTVYLGGGTPSALGPDRLERALDVLRTSLPVAEGAEITVELNPDDVGPELLGALARAGVDRLSVGVQTFDDEALRWLGRRHDSRQSLAALEAIRRAGFPVLAVDVMLGWPGQDERALRRDLDRAVAFEPEHVSAYELTLEAATPLGREARAGRLRPADEEAQRRLLLAAFSHLEGHGYDHYEVSNYARGRAHRSRHNGKYWCHAPYLGLGPGAHSLSGRRRWWNGRDLGLHLDRLAAGEPPETGSETLTDEQLALEALLLGLRTADGVRAELLDVLPRGRELARQLEAEGLLVVDERRARPTTEGLLVADGLALRFAP